MIIGISGYARSGKDSVAEILVREHGFRRVAFADKLREFLLAVNPIVEVEKDSDELWSDEGFIREVLNVRVVRVSDVIDWYGWDRYKESPYNDEIRGLLQRLGTEAGRNLLGENVWVDALFAGVGAGEKIVIPDTRFPNEYEAITTRGGFVWRTERPGVAPANSHASETSLDNHEFHARISNDGTLNDLERKVKETFLSLPAISML